MQTFRRLGRILGRDSSERSDNDPAKADEESEEDIPDDMDNVFTMNSMDDTMLPKGIHLVNKGVCIKPLCHSPRNSEKTFSCQLTVLASCIPTSTLGCVCLGGIARLQDVFLTSIRCDVAC